MTSESFERKTIQLGDLSYPVLEAGEGPLVVCLHGFPDNYESFQNQIMPLAEAGYRVVCPMLPGHDPGNQRKSGSNNPVYCTGEIIALIELLLEEQPVKQCHLVGHDWGAVLCYMVAVKRPDLLASLMVISIPFNISLTRVVLRAPSYAINAWYMGFFQMKGLADVLVRRNNYAFLEYLYRSWGPTDWPNFDQHIASVKRTFAQPGVLTAALSFYRNSIVGLNRVSWQWKRALQSDVEVPTLAVRGEIDNCIPEHAWDLVSPKSFRKGLTLEVLPGVGHFAQLEQPEMVNTLLLKWLKQNE